MKKVSSGTLIPRPAAAIAQIDPVGQQDEGFGGEGEFHLAGVGRLRPGEGALLEALAHHPQAGPVMIEQFDPVAPVVGEGEERPALGIFLERFLGKRVEPVEGLAHVAGFDGQVDPEVAGEAEHAQGLGLKAADEFGGQSHLRPRADPETRTAPEFDFEALVGRDLERWLNQDEGALAGNDRLRCLLPALPPRGKGLILDPMVPREGDARHSASLELIKNRLAPLRRNLDPAQFVALQNLTRSIGLGHTRHSAYATTSMMRSSRGARLDAYDIPEGGRDIRRSTQVARIRRVK